METRIRAERLAALQQLAVVGVRCGRIPAVNVQPLLDRLPVRQKLVDVWTSPERKARLAAWEAEKARRRRGLWTRRARGDEARGGVARDSPRARLYARRGARG